MIERDHRYGYESVKTYKTEAEKAQRWDEASYWLGQQLAIERREEIQSQHQTSILMDVLLAVIAVMTLIGVLMR